MANVDERVSDRLIEAGVRYSAGRKAVVGSLATLDGPRSAAELNEILGEAVPLSSLYRSLSVLESASIIQPYHGPDGVTRYELAEWLTGHHHHLVCRSCGIVDDVAPPPEAEAHLESAISLLTSSGRFQATGHVLEIDGMCAQCA